MFAEKSANNFKIKVARSLCKTNLKIADSILKKNKGIIVAIKSQHYL